MQLKQARVSPDYQAVPAPAIPEADRYGTSITMVGLPGDSSLDILEAPYQAALLQNVSDAIIATNLEFHVTVWNRAAETMYGWREDEALGRTVNELFHTEAVGVSQAEMAHQLFEAGGWHGEVIQYAKDGRRLVVMSSVNLVRNQNGRAVGVVAVNRDVTANRRTEEQLNTLSRAIEQSPVCVVITDINGYIEYVNPIFTQLTGYTFEEVEGKNPRFLKSGETSRAQYQELWRTILSGKQWQGELHNRTKDGRLFWEHVRISPVFNRNGKIAHFVAIKEDITARKQRELVQNALLELAMALRAASGHEEVLHAILQQSAHIVDAPVACFTAYDATADSVQVEALLRHGELHTGLAIPLAVEKATFSSVITSGTPLLMDDILTNPRLPMLDFVGEERAMYSVPLTSHGETLGVLTLLRKQPFTQEDVRFVLAAADMAAVALQRANLHDKVLRHTVDLEYEVAKRTKELAEANERLKELDRLKSKFVSNVTHELRTPVTNIGLYLKLLERKPEKLADYMHVLAEQADRLHILVKDTLDLSKLDHSAETLKLDDVDINEIARAIVTAHSVRAESQGLLLLFEPAPDLPVIAGDVDRLTQVFTNLVANAINYTPAGQVVVSTWYDARKRVQCTVRDTGCGIYPEDLPHLFARFYRGKRDQHAPVPGTGLGLSIVKEIVEMHGGQIDVSSQVGQGSSFTVSLPFCTIEPLQGEARYVKSPGR